MAEQTAIHPVEEVHKSHSRRLRGMRLWLARSAYILLFSSVVTFFIAGLKPFMEYWDTGNIGAGVTQNTAGELVFYIYKGGDADTAGIKDGDLLQAINGMPVTSAVEANKLLVGKIGDPITLTVLPKHQFPHRVDLIYAGGFLHLLESMHLSLGFLKIYYLVFSGLLGVAAICCSPLVFFRRSNDWLVILVAFSMIAFASLFVWPVGFGTARLHVFFMNTLIYQVGVVTMIIVFFLYPTGLFVPRWTRWIAILLLVPATLDFINLVTYNNTLLDLALWIGFILLAVFAQIYRYRKVSTPIERQQTKRLVFGAVACFLIIVILDILSIFLPYFMSNAQYILFELIVKAGSTLPIIILELSFVFAIYRYRLWDTDVYINRTVMYSLVTLFLMLVWILTTQVLNYASQQLFDKQVGWLGAILSSLQVAVIYKPVRSWVEKWVNKRFYKDRIDYEKALVELQPVMWNYLTPVDLVHTLVAKVPALLQSTSAALFIQEQHALALVEVQDLHPSEANKFQFTPAILKKLEKGEAVNLPEGEPFKILVPLTVPRLQVHDLVGILAFGPRTKGRGYSRDHLNDLASLGRSAGTALHMLRLSEKKQTKRASLVTHA
jgi:hypothetical protein